MFGHLCWRLQNLGTPQSCKLEIVNLGRRICWVQVTLNTTRGEVGAPEQHLVLAGISKVKIIAAATRASGSRYRKKVKVPWIPATYILSGTKA